MATMTASRSSAKTPNKKTRSTLINIAYNPKKSNETEFLEKIALSLDHAQAYNPSLILMRNGNLNYLDNVEKNLQLYFNAM